MKMKLFQKKQHIFGDTVEPDCAYCRFNSSPEGGEEVSCPNWSEEKSHCRRYQYDPTRRVPKGAPKLRQYNQEDFTL